MDGFSFIHKAAYKDLAQRLLELGHKRISKVTRKERREPALANIEQEFFELLAPAGIRPDSISLPDWEETPEGFHKLLESLFRFTPPTALILPESYLVHAAFQFFAQKGIKVPKDVSIISIEDCEDFKWSVLPITRFYHDWGKACNSVSKWIDFIHSGKPAPKQKTVYPAEFIEGGTLAAAHK